MFERHFGLRENPFPAGHQLRFLYPSREHQEARAHLRFGIENREPFALITGEVGTGKTTALYDALAEWGEQVNVALITNSALTRQELLEEICIRFGVDLPADCSKPKALALLERHLEQVRARGTHAVLLLDEAQNLEPGLLEEIRLLSNLESRGDKLMQIFLIGQPELEGKLARPDLRQLRQRITVHYRLNPLSPEETAGYIHHHISVAGGNAWVVFPPEACREVYRITHGIPREINTVASAALLTAFTEGQPSVRPEHVRSVASENEFRSVLGEARADDGDPAGSSSFMSALETPAPAPPPPPAARIAEPPVAAAPPPPPPVPSPSSPAWSPPELARTSERAPEPPAPAPAAVVPPTPAPAPTPAPQPVDPVQREEMDAWSLAARDLMEAKRRESSGSIANPFAGSRVANAVGARAAEPEAPRFPTPAELHERSPHAEPSRADLSGLPPRLRERLEREIDEDDRKRPPMALFIGIAALVGIAIASVLAQRFGAIDLPLLRGIAGGRAATAAAKAHAADSLKAHARDTLAASAPAVHESTSTAVTKPVPAAAVAPPPPSAATLAAQATRIYGIAVASYLDPDRADQERARLSDVTGLTGRIIPYKDSGTTMYRIVLGTFGDQASAEERATDLMQHELIKEGRVLVTGHTGGH